MGVERDSVVIWNLRESWEEETIVTKYWEKKGYVHSETEGRQSKNEA